MIIASSIGKEYNRSSDGKLSQIASECLDIENIA